MADTPLHLYDPRNGDLALRVAAFADPESLSRPQRTNYFSLYWVKEGTGTFWADLGGHRFAPNSLLCLVPYQSFRIVPEGAMRGIVVQFHANFLCIETHHEEVGCNGVLFNDVYGIPVVELDDEHAREFCRLLADMERELQSLGLAQSEVLLSYLKILLVRASRLKLRQQDDTPQVPSRLPPVLADLRLLIEKHFRQLHAPADYAQLLHLAPKSLAKVVKTHLHKTLTELIRERLVKEAKWELLHTTKPIKQIAAAIGFADELYFSRLFKRATGCSPTFFREYETAIRGGRNLSMK
jgi:AraC-like DNA-binding protein